MATITPTNSLAEALTQALAAATAEQPAEAAKLQRAYVIASTRVIAPQGATGYTYWCQSQHVDDAWYLVDTAHHSCNCQDAQRHPDALCKHALAVALRRWALQCVTEAQRKADFGRFYYTPQEVPSCAN